MSSQPKSKRGQAAAAAGQHQQQQKDDRQPEPTRPVRPSGRTRRKSAPPVSPEEIPPQLLAGGKKSLGGLGRGLQTNIISPKTGKLAVTPIRSVLKSKSTKDIVADAHKVRWHQNVTIEEHSDPADDTDSKEDKEDQDQLPSKPEGGRKTSDPTEKARKKEAAAAAAMNGQSGSGGTSNTVHGH